MTRLLRAGAATLVVALTVAVGPAALAAPRQASPSVASADDAVDDLVSCIQGSNRLLVTFLIDESGSLQTKDPKNRRVDVAESALDQLVALSDGTGGGDRVSVEVTFAAFANQYEPVRDWTSVTADNRDSLRSSLERFRKRNKGTDTDFDLALTGAREALAARIADAGTAAADAAPCKAVLLFTDGGFDLTRRTKASAETLGRTKPYAPGADLTTKAGVEKAVQAGREELCRVGGVADQVRNDDITLLTVALVSTIDDATRPLAAATAGRADGLVCGTPTDRAPGAYLPAERDDVLISRFDEITTRVAGGTPVEGASEVAACGGDACAEGTRTFKLDRGVRRAHLLAVPPSGATAAIILQGPGGDSERVEKPGAFTVGEMSGRAAAVAGGALSIDLTRPTGSADGWDGTWTAALGTEGKAIGQPGSLSVYLFSDLGIRIAKVANVVRGQTATVTATLVLPGGFDAARLLTATEAAVRFVDPVSGSTVKGFDPVTLTGPPAGPFSGEVPVPLDTTISSVEATVALRATTTEGAVVTSQSATKSVPVLRPAGSVQFKPALLAFPSVDGTDATSTSFFLLGGSKVGCVWLGRTKVPTAPDGAAPIEVTIDGKEAASRADCIKVPANARVAVEVAAKAAGRASGTVRGTIEVFEEVEGTAAPTTTLVPFRFDLTRGVDQARRLALALALAAGGILLPMLLLYLVNAATARFQRFDAVLGATLPVVVTDGQVLRPNGSRLVPLSFQRSDFGPLTHAKSRRQFEFGGVRFRARPARNPFAAVVATAAPAGGAEKLKGGAGSKVELDPGLAGSWVFLLDADDTRAAGPNAATGHVLAFVADGDLDVQAGRMLPDIEARLPRTAQNLAVAVRKATPKALSKRQQRAAAADQDIDAPGDDEVVTDDAASTEDEVPTDVPASGEAPPADPADGPPGAPLGFGGAPRP